MCTRALSAGGSLDRGGCETQHLAQVLKLEIRILGQDFLFSHALCQEANYGGDGNPQFADARYAPHLIRVDSDPAEAHR